MDVLRNESRVSSLFNRTREGLEQGETMRFVLDMITVIENGMYMQVMTNNTNVEAVENAYWRLMQ